MILAARLPIRSAHAAVGISNPAYASVNALKTKLIVSGTSGASTSRTNNSC